MGYFRNKESGKRIICLPDGVNVMTIEEFVNELSLEKRKLCENFYKDEDRKNNLITYLKEMEKLKPRVLFIGEAPGYLGCAITGIPFTDERVIKEYNCIPGNYVIKGSQKEKSAKALWDVLKETDSVPLLWNAFPLHPYKEGNVRSNRQPTLSEKKEIGEKYIKYIIDLFNIEEVYAVGLQAFDTLRRMDIEGFDKTKEKSYIRHPSYGGRKQCQEKIRGILGRA